MVKRDEFHVSRVQGLFSESDWPDPNPLEVRYASLDAIAGWQLVKVRISEDERQEIDEIRDPEKKRARLDLIGRVRTLESDLAARVLKGEITAEERARILEKGQLPRSVVRRLPAIQSLDLEPLKSLNRARVNKEKARLERRKHHTHEPAREEAQKIWKENPTLTRWDVAGRVLKRLEDQGFPVEDLLTQETVWDWIADLEPSRG